MAAHKTKANRYYYSCTSRSLKASHVITATGVDAAIAQGIVLFSLGIDDPGVDVKYVLEKLPPTTVERLREMSPLYHQRHKGN